jgi:hypothetical protein
MLTEEDPQQHGPRDHRRAKALHGAIAAPWAGPAGQAQPGDASGHDEQGGYDPAQLLEHRCRAMGSEAWEKCYKVPPGLLRRLVRVAVVVDDNSTTAL